ncbi:MAG: rhomboid family intramembrane serine protease, partial [Chitinivibrionales bacterium]|nr:rhomboid family intramembrane serine protease [Chitinivibrionales bacterium]
MIPLKVDSVPNRFPIVTALFIALCLAAFFMRDQFAAYGHGFVPVDFMYGLLHPGRSTADTTLALLLSFFLHAGPLHLLSNMWYLWIFGSALEYTTGMGVFTVVYLVCGIVSMIAQAVSTPLSSIPVIGASGAVAGVMGAMMVLLPFSRVVLWFPPIFFIRFPAVFFLLFWFIIQYLGMRRSIPEGGGVA